MKIDWAFYCLIIDTMLFPITLALDFLAMGVTLWLAFYLLARGFPSLLSLKAVVLLLSLSGFFSSAYLNLFNPIAGNASLRAILLVIGLSMFLSMVDQLSREYGQMKKSSTVIFVYVLGLIAAIGLFTTRSAFVGEETNLLRVGQMSLGWPFTLYGIFQVATSVTILYILIGKSKFGYSLQGRFFLVAAIASSIGVVYGVWSLASSANMPRVIQDSLIFISIFIFGLAVARHQVMVERRTILRDLPISSLSILGLSGLYALGAFKFTSSFELMGIVYLFSILTHSAYDLAREYLDHRRRSAESDFRQQLRQINSDLGLSGTRIAGLQTGLEVLCREIGTEIGFIAIREKDSFKIAATHNSLRLGTSFSASAFLSDDILETDAPFLPDILWLAPAYSGMQQVATVGIGSSSSRLSYSTDDLDLFAEVADRIGPIIALELLQKNISDDGKLEGSDKAENKTSEMINLLTFRPPKEFVKQVEEGLRNLSDYIKLGQMGLVAWANINGETHIERGKSLRKLLLESIEKFRPVGDRPSEPLPREWYHYTILHDAYVEDVKNNEIMARLYISEGTFNRTRRIALRGLARLLIEQQKNPNTPQ